jgi:mRNA-degrading endonuclease RelE of RelBE toxin-antitoxin system
MVEAFRPEDWPRFVRFPAFSRDWERLGLDDTALRDLESEILKGPDRTPVIQGTGGLRKIRFTEPGSGRGKRGAYRICYVVFPEFGTIALVAVFGKTEKSDLTQTDRRTIAAMIKNYRAELEREFAWRQSTQVEHKRGGSNGKAG